MPKDSNKDQTQPVYLVRRFFPSSPSREELIRQEMGQTPDPFIALIKNQRALDHIRRSICSENNGIEESRARSPRK